jgi:ectoine hydroxylase-related dioxygenase (phytanoyl-CoA dioxygenase family)
MMSRLLTSILLVATLVATGVAQEEACNNPNAATDATGKSHVVDRLLEALLPLAEGLQGAELDDFIQQLKERGEGNNNNNNDTIIPDDQKSWEDYKYERAWGDRFVRSIAAILNDPECMDDNYSLDVASPDFDVEDVIRIFDKCRVMVLRNFFPKDELTEYKKKITSYLTGISTGRISEQGTTSLSGEPYYFKENGKSRYDICFTPDMLNERIMADDLLLEILKDEFMLDNNLLMLDFGVILAGRGAPLQDWHRDMGDYIFASSLGTSGVAGHDLPPFAVAVITPLLDVKPEHGPTEFCMGTSQLVGIDYMDLSDVPLKDESLRELLNEYSFYQCKDDSGIAYDGCPPQAWRAPLLNFGDLLLFDYNMVHRGGPNNSQNTRTMIYNTYVRSWFKVSPLSCNVTSDRNKACDFSHRCLCYCSHRTPTFRSPTMPCMPKKTRRIMGKC